MVDDSRDNDNYDKHGKHKYTMRLHNSIGGYPDFSFIGLSKDLVDAVRDRFF